MFQNGGQQTLILLPLQEVYCLKALKCRLAAFKTGEVSSYSEQYGQGQICRA